jgi:hypothetical protein
LSFRLRRGFGRRLVVLTACTGSGGGYLPPDTVFTGKATFGFNFSCEDKGGLNPPTGQLRLQLTYSDHGTSTFLGGLRRSLDPLAAAALGVVGALWGAGHGQLLSATTVPAGPSWLLPAA